MLFIEPDVDCFLLQFLDVRVPASVLRLKPSSIAAAAAFPSPAELTTAPQPTTASGGEDHDVASAAAISLEERADVVHRALLRTLHARYPYEAVDTLEHAYVLVVTHRVSPTLAGPAADAARCCSSSFLSTLPSERRCRTFPSHLRHQLDPAHTPAAGGGGRPSIRVTGDDGEDATAARAPAPEEEGTTEAAASHCYDTFFLLGRTLTAAQQALYHAVQRGGAVPHPTGTSGSGKDDADSAVSFAVLHGHFTHHVAADVTGVCGGDDDKRVGESATYRVASPQQERAAPSTTSPTSAAAADLRSLCFSVYRIPLIRFEPAEQRYCTTQREELRWRQRRRCRASHRAWCQRQQSQGAPDAPRRPRDGERTACLSSSSSSSDGDSESDDRERSADGGGADAASTTPQRCRDVGDALDALFGEEGAPAGEHTTAAEQRSAARFFAACHAMLTNYAVAHTPPSARPQRLPGVSFVGVTRLLYSLAPCDCVHLVLRDDNALYHAHSSHATHVPQTVPLCLVSDLSPETNDGGGSGDPDRRTAAPRPSFTGDGAAYRATQLRQTTSRAPSPEPDATGRVLYLGRTAPEPPVDGGRRAGLVRTPGTSRAPSPERDGRVSARTATARATAWSSTAGAPSSRTDGTLRVTACLISSGISGHPRSRPATLADKGVRVPSILLPDGAREVGGGGDGGDGVSGPRRRDGATAVNLVRALARSSLAQHRLRCGSIRPVLSVAVLDTSREPTAEERLCGVAGAPPPQLSSRYCCRGLVDHTWLSIPVQHAPAEQDAVQWMPVLLGSTDWVSDVGLRTAVHLGIFPGSAPRVSTAADVAAATSAGPSDEWDGVLPTRERALSSLRPSRTSTTATTRPTAAPTAAAPTTTAGPLRVRPVNCNVANVVTAAAAPQKKAKSVVACSRGGSGGGGAVPVLHGTGATGQDDGATGGPPATAVTPARSPVSSAAPPPPPPPRPSSPTPRHPGTAAITAPDAVEEGRGSDAEVDVVGSSSSSSRSRQSPTSPPVTATSVRIAPGGIALTFDAPSAPPQPHHDRGRRPRSTLTTTTTTTNTVATASTARRHTNQPATVSTRRDSALHEDDDDDDSEAARAESRSRRERRGASLAAETVAADSDEDERWRRRLFAARDPRGAAHTPSTPRRERYAGRAARDARESAASLSPRWPPHQQPAVPKAILWADEPIRRHGPRAAAVSRTDTAVELALSEEEAEEEEELQAFRRLHGVGAVASVSRRHSSAPPLHRTPPPPRPPATRRAAVAPGITEDTQQNELLRCSTPPRPASRRRTSTQQQQQQQQQQDWWGDLSPRRHGGSVFSSTSPAAAAPRRFSPGTLSLSASAVSVSSNSEATGVWRPSPPRQRQSVVTRTAWDARERRHHLCDVDTAGLPAAAAAAAVDPSMYHTAPSWASRQTTQQQRRPSRQTSHGVADGGRDCRESALWRSPPPRHATHVQPPPLLLASPLVRHTLEAGRRTPPPTARRSVWGGPAAPSDRRDFWCSLRADEHTDTDTASRVRPRSVAATDAAWWRSSREQGMTSPPASSGRVAPSAVAAPPRPSASALYVSTADQPYSRSSRCGDAGRGGDGWHVSTAAAVPRACHPLHQHPYENHKAWRRGRRWPPRMSDAGEAAAEEDEEEDAVVEELSLSPVAPHRSLAQPAADVCEARRSRLLLRSRPPLAPRYSADRRGFDVSSSSLSGGAMWRRGQLLRERRSTAERPSRVARYCAHLQDSFLSGAMPKRRCFERRGDDSGGVGADAHGRWSVPSLPTARETAWVRPRMSRTAAAAPLLSRRLERRASGRCTRSAALTSWAAAGVPPRGPATLVAVSPAATPLSTGAAIGAPEARAVDATRSRNAEAHLHQQAEQQRHMDTRRAAEALVGSAAAATTTARAAAAAAAALVTGTNVSFTLRDVASVFLRLPSTAVTRASTSGAPHVVGGAGLDVLDVCDAVRRTAGVSCILSHAPTQLRGGLASYLDYIHRCHEPCFYLREQAFVLLLPVPHVPTLKVCVAIHNVNDLVALVCQTPVSRLLPTAEEDWMRQRLYGEKDATVNAADDEDKGDVAGAGDAPRVTQRWWPFCVFDRRRAACVSARPTPGPDGDARRRAECLQQQHRVDGLCLTWRHRMRIWFALLRAGVHCTEIAASTSPLLTDAAACRARCALLCGRIAAYAAVLHRRATLGAVRHANRTSRATAEVARRHVPMLCDRPRPRPAPTLQLGGRGGWPSPPLSDQQRWRLWGDGAGLARVERGGVAFAVDVGPRTGAPTPHAPRRPPWRACVQPTRPPPGAWNTVHMRPSPHRCFASLASGGSTRTAAVWPPTGRSTRSMQLRRAASLRVVAGDAPASSLRHATCLSARGDTDNARRWSGHWGDVRSAYASRNCTLTPMAGARPPEHRHVDSHPYVGQQRHAAPWEAAAATASDVPRAAATVSLASYASSGSLSPSAAATVASGSLRCSSTAVTAPLRSATAADITGDDEGDEDDYGAAIELPLTVALSLAPLSCQSTRGAGAGVVNVGEAEDHLSRGGDAAAAAAAAAASSLPPCAGVVCTPLEVQQRHAPCFDIAVPQVQLLLQWQWEHHQHSYTLSPTPLCGTAPASATALDIARWSPSAHAGGVEDAAAYPSYAVSPLAREVLLHLLRWSWLLPIDYEANRWSSRRRGRVAAAGAPRSASLLLTRRRGRIARRRRSTVLLAVLVAVLATDHAAWCIYAVLLGGAAYCMVSAATVGLVSSPPSHRAGRSWRWRRRASLESTVPPLDARVSLLHSVGASTTRDLLERRRLHSASQAVVARVLQLHTAIAALVSRLHLFLCGYSTALSLWTTVLLLAYAGLYVAYVEAARAAARRGGATGLLAAVLTPPTHLQGTASRAASSSTAATCARHVEEVPSAIWHAAGALLQAWWTHVTPAAPVVLQHPQSRSPDVAQSSSSSSSSGSSESVAGGGGHQRSFFYQNGQYYTYDAESPAWAATTTTTTTAVVERTTTTTTVAGAAHTDVDTDAAHATATEAERGGVPLRESGSASGTETACAEETGTTAHVSHGSGRGGGPTTEPGVLWYLVLAYGVTVYLPRSPFRWLWRRVWAVLLNDDALVRLPLLTV